MKNTAEVLTNQTGAESIAEIRQQAEMKVTQIENEAQEVEQEAQSLELELLEAQASHEAKEEAERQAHETAEKIGGLA